MKTAVITFIFLLAAFLAAFGSYQFSQDYCPSLLILSCVTTYIGVQMAVELKGK